jgi:hypothetical protein
MPRLGLDRPSIPSWLSACRRVDFGIALGIDACASTLAFVSRLSSPRLAVRFFPEHVGPYVVLNSLACATRSDVLVLCSRQVNNTALSSTPLFDDIVGVPHGNGEDIILSFAAMAMSRSLNFAYPLHAEHYPNADAAAIHRRWAGHIEHRQQVVRRCRKVFSL